MRCPLRQSQLLQIKQCFPNLPKFGRESFSPISKHGIFFSSNQGTVLLVCTLRAYAWPASTVSVRKPFVTFGREDPGLRQHSISGMSRTVLQRESSVGQRARKIVSLDCAGAARNALARKNLLIQALVLSTLMENASIPLSIKGVNSKGRGIRNSILCFRFKPIRIPIILRRLTLLESTTRELSLEESAIRRPTVGFRA